MKKWIAIFTVFIFIACAEEEVVTCHLMGQLGNQLYETAAPLAYSWDYGVKAIFPGMNTDWERLAYNRDHIFFRLDSKPVHKEFAHTFRETIWHSSERIPYKENQLLVGYFQSWKHFHHHRERLLEIYAPSEENLNYLHHKYADILAHPQTVSIHVRTLDKGQHDRKDFPFLGMEYYRNAVKLFPKDALFVVFSDRINWCKQHFQDICKNVVFIEGNDHIHDLFLMSMMKHNIICNSTFSWWGAYLNTNPDRVVVAPDQWMHPDRYRFPPPQPNDFYLPDWRIAKAIIGKYPEDMTWYDDHSQSLGQ